MANRGTQELRRPFRYKVYLLRKGAMPVLAEREMSPGDFQPGETKTVDPDFSISSADFASGTELAIALDTDYRIAESDELSD